VIRSVRVPRLTPNGEFSRLGWPSMTLSRDARFLSFRVIEPRGAQRVARSGVVDLATGQVTYGCDVGCLRIVLR